MNPAGRSLLGLLLAGWGIFNVVEGIIDHHLLGIHNVKPGPSQLLFDLGFLALGAVLLAVGFVLYRSSIIGADPLRPVLRRQRSDGRFAGVLSGHSEYLASDQRERPRTSWG